MERKREVEGQRPIHEPPNSTVSDWHGQKVSDDMDLIDRLLEETEGDHEEAEKLFWQLSAYNDPERDINRPKPA